MAEGDCEDPLLACTRIAEQMVRLEAGGMPKTDEAYQFLNQLLHHALARKRRSLQRGIASWPKYATLMLPQQQVQLGVQLHVLRTLAQRAPGQPLSLPKTLKDAFLLFDPRDRGAPQRDPNAFQSASRIAHRISDPCSYLLEILEAQYQPGTLHPSLLLTERDRIVARRIEERTAALESTARRNPEHQLELKKLKALDLQQHVRWQLTDGVTWHEVATGELNDAFNLSTPHHTAEQVEQRWAMQEERDALLDLKTRMVQERQHHTRFRQYQRRVFHIARTLAVECSNVVAQRERAKKEEAVREKREEMMRIKEQEGLEYSSLLDRQKALRFEEFDTMTDKYLESRIGAMLNRPIDSTFLTDDTFDHKVFEEVTRDHIEQPSMLRVPLKEYQLKGVSWLLSLFRAKTSGMIGDERELGSVQQVLGLMAHLLETGTNYGPFLIVTPQQSRDEWYRAVTSSLPGATVAILDGEKQKPGVIRRFLEKRSHNIVISTYDFVMQNGMDFAYMSWEYVVLNHPQYAAQVPLIPAERLLMITNTALPTDLAHLWSLVLLLHPDIFSTSRGFDSWFSETLVEQGFPSPRNERILMDEERYQAADVCLTVLAPFTMCRKLEDVEAPKSVRYLLCGLSSTQRFMYDAIANRQIKTDSPLDDARLVCQHPGLLLEKPPRGESLVTQSGKVFALDQVLLRLVKTSRRAAVMVQSGETLDLLEAFLKHRRYKYQRVDTSVPKQNRAALVDAFADPKAPTVLLAQSALAGGIRLPAEVDTMVLFDSDFSYPHVATDETVPIVELHLIAARTLEQQGRAFGPSMAVDVPSADPSVLDEALLRYEGETDQFAKVKSTLELAVDTPVPDWALRWQADNTLQPAAETVDAVKGEAGQKRERESGSGKRVYVVQGEERSGPLAAEVQDAKRQRRA